MPAPPSSDPKQFVQGAPVLHVPDVAATAAFYRDVLGFTSDFGDDRYAVVRSEEHTSELQSQSNLVCRLLLEKKKKRGNRWPSTFPDLSRRGMPGGSFCPGDFAPRPTASLGYRLSRSATHAWTGHGQGAWRRR